MSGITVLQSIDTTPDITTEIISIIIFAIAAVISLVSLINMINEFGIHPKMIIPIINMIICLVGISTCIYYCTNLPHTTQYQIIIDDNVDAKKFNEHYKVIEKSGFTYWVEKFNNE